MQNVKYDFVKSNLNELKLSDAELDSLVDIQHLSEIRKVALKEFVFTLSIILYQSFQNEES